MYVLGTAGHVDHGKSSLVKALTGIDPDRLREEKERQMTIDLGFAWLYLPSGREIGIVDVPGHRDFIENMLAGVGGIEAVLLVIAADEGIMPQTREHLAIIDLLEIKNGIIVLTKVDLVEDQEWVGLVMDEIRGLVRGTSLSEADIVPVSALNGSGINELVGKIDELLEKSAAKKDIGRPRLPIDRVFSLKGFGTVVTGTLLEGRFSVGQQVMILPGGMESRIRGIQTHKKKTSEAEPGTRTALNLVGVEVDQLRRGDVVTGMNALKPTRRIDLRFRMVKDAGRKLVHDEFVKVFTGTAQNHARVRIIAADEVLPGQEGWLQLEFSDEIVVCAGDHCVLRRPSPPETIGGGIVLDPYPARRHKRFSEATISHFELLETGEPAEIILDLLAKAGPLEIYEIADQSGLSIADVKEQIEMLVTENQLVLFDDSKAAGKDRSIFIHIDWIKRWIQQTEQILKKFHSDFPLREGMKKDALRAELELSPRLFTAVLDYLRKNRVIVQKSDLVCLPGHQIVFDPEHEKNKMKLMKLFAESPFSPASFQELAAEFGNDLLAALIDRGDLVRTSDQVVFRREEFERMLSFTDECLKREGNLDLGRLRDEFNTSRKYALSFLEYLDQIGHTERKGDTRVLRAG